MNVFCRLSSAEQLDIINLYNCIGLPLLDCCISMHNVFEIKMKANASTGTIYLYIRAGDSETQKVYQSET